MPPEGRKRTRQVGDAGLRKVERRMAKQCSHKGSLLVPRPVSAKGGWAEFYPLSYLLTVMEEKTTTTEDQRVLLKTHTHAAFVLFSLHLDRCNRTQYRDLGVTPGSA